MSSQRKVPLLSGRRAGWILLVLGAWGLTAPYAGEALGFEVNVRPIVEVVDHVVPGVAVLAAAAFALATGRLPLIPAMLSALAGFWMTSTHLPLLLQVRDQMVGLGAALWHSVPGILILLVSAVAVIVAWPEEEPGPQAEQEMSRKKT